MIRGNLWAREASLSGIIRPISEGNDPTAHRSRYQQMQDCKLRSFEDQLEAECHSGRAMKK